LSIQDAGGADLVPGLIVTTARSDDGWRSQSWHGVKQHFYRAGLVTLLLASAACATPPTTSQDASAAIDRFYLETVRALKKSDEAAIRRLTRKVDALPSTAESHDPCLNQKRRQLLPILLSLAVIDGLADTEEQQALRAEALRHLIGLSEPGGSTADGDLCFGRGFPPVLLGEH
jgi:hypothetical protein